MEFLQFLNKLRTSSNSSLLESIIAGYRVCFEAVGANRATLKSTGEAFWIGSVNLLDGEIEEIHTYEKAKSFDFHHSFYFSLEQQEAMRNGESTAFWVDEDGVATFDKVPFDIIRKINDQIIINSN